MKSDLNHSNSTCELIPDFLGQLGDLLDAAGGVNLLEDGVQLAAGLLALAEAEPHVLQI